MNIHPDPIWPWSDLRTQFGLLSGPLWLFLACAAVYLFALPFLLRGGERSQKVAKWGPIVLVGLLVFAGFREWSSLGQTGRGIGLLLMLLLPLALISLTISSYIGVGEATPRKVGALVALRLLAFVVVLLAIFRPALAFSENEASRAVLFVVVDWSESMEVKDSYGKKRWDYLLERVRESKPLLDTLAEEKKIETRFFKFAVGLEPFDLEKPGQAKGARTDFGTMLHSLYGKRDSGTPVLGVLVLSDGADNGTTYTALSEASRWERTPIETFGFGKESSGDNRSDVSIVSLQAEPTPVPVKGKLTMKATIDAPGYKGVEVRLRLFLEGEEVQSKDVFLTQTTGNVVSIDCVAPNKPGDVMVKVRVEDKRRLGMALPGEVTDKNNEKVTFVPVTKEGFSVLFVDKLRGFEPQQISYALKEDARLNLTDVQLRGDQPADLDTADLFQFARKEYDVIILGDVTPNQLRAVNPRALEEIGKQVEAGTGLLMIGGYASFGPAWRGTPIAPLLPVDVGNDAQVEKDVKMVPTEEGLRKFSYVLRLGDTPEATRKVWEEFHPLEGLNNLTVQGDRTLVSVLAKSPDGKPILVSKRVGAGRVMAFAGDSTHRWIRSRELVKLHHRFWLQLVRWLGKQDEVEGSVWVRPDTRNLPLRNDLGFSVGLRTKEGVEFGGGTFEVKVHTPGGQTVPVKTVQKPEGERGVFVAKDLRGNFREPGIYRIEASGSGTSPSGDEVSGTGTSRFVIEDDEIEKSRKAADLTFLKKLAASGGGQFHLPSELQEYLEELQGREKQENRLQTTTWPAWRTNSMSPFFVFFYLFFVAVLAGEWLLRRAWGLV